MTSSDTPPIPRRAMPWPKKILLWTRTLHIYLSIFALLLLLFFAMTGFMMNHPDWFNVDGQTTATSQAIIPAEVLNPKADKGSQDLSITEYFRAHLGARGEVDRQGLGDEPMTLSFKGPHYSLEASIDANGHATITKTSNSLSGFLGNLHKGADTGAPWKRIIDTTSILLAVVSLTGLILWLSLAKRRTLGLVSLALCLILALGAFFLFVP